MLAQRDIPGTRIVVCPEAFPALAAADGIVIQAALTQILTVEFGMLLPWPLTAADVADKGAF
ncbi:hypothetical protein BACCAP_02927 [Pseudoflavonifractor capillosus ATCC 29799]|uniref:Uncharacterized protein n=1 Tax=Pseudoflavonifractor capillosus ATCC 29799 TaxID=411467 RepID=A6NXI1_9FIRM|nr:hypothetical protein BACCAP_02927 [Pseudoflavonifractor capillosus ATCC 29799]